jgi:molybdate transport system substrate-binding protein
MGNLQKTMNLIGVIMISAAMYLVLDSLAEATEIRVLTSVVLKPALDALAPRFESESGIKVLLQDDLSPAIARQKLAEGESFDVAMASTAVIDDLVKKGIMTAEVHKPFGFTYASLAYRSGTSPPDISTLDKLKSVVLNAKSISYSDPAEGGASSLYFAKKAEQLGISDAVRQKAIVTRITQGAVPVGQGQAEIGIAQGTEIAAVPGVEGIPISPLDPNSKSSYEAGVSSKAVDAEAGRTFVKFLFSPESVAILKSKGILAD